MHRYLLETLDDIPAIDLDLDTSSSSYQAFLKETQEVNITEVLNEFEISRSYFEEPLFLSDEEIKSHIKDHIPPIAVLSVSRISFRKIPGRHGDEMLGKFGYWYTEQGRREPEIAISYKVAEDEYRQKLMESKLEGMGDEDAAEKTKDFVLYAISHEFGHALHYLLPPAALRRWHTTVTANPTAPTEYAESATNREGRRYSDDFAESFAMFIHHPEKLKVISLPRFEGMEQIFIDTMPNYEKSDEIQKL